MRNSRLTISVITSLIVVFSLIAVLAGLLYQSPGAPYDFTSLRGETVKIHGSGLYRFDSISMAVQAKAQDIVTLFIGIPLLVVSLNLFMKKRLRGRLLLTGTLGYFLYTYTTYAFLAAYNELFLIYTALFSLCLFGFILSIRSVHIDGLPDRFSERLPRKFISGFLIFFGVLLLFMWLGRILPSLARGDAPYGLEIYSTLVIQALDLGVNIPVGVLSGILLLKKTPWGYLLASIFMIKGLTMFMAVSAMAVGQKLSGVPIATVELFIFPFFTFVNIVLTIILFKHIEER